MSAALVFGAWTAFGLVMAQGTALDVHLRGTQRSLVSIVGTSMLGAWIWAICTPFVAAWTRRMRPFRERGLRGWSIYLVGHLACAIAVTAFDAVLYHYIRPLIDGVETPIPRLFTAVLLLDLALYGVVATIAETLEYARRTRDLQGKLDEARLHALEAQLRPHFLYNTLNLIAELVHDEPEAADEMLTRLGVLLRRSYTDMPHLVPLGAELDTVRAYTDILARRFRGRVSVRIDVPAELRDQVVPAFSLQPLVENAFRHGVERREEGSLVEVSAMRDRESVVVRIADRGVGLERALMNQGPTYRGLPPQSDQTLGTWGLDSSRPPKTNIRVPNTQTGVGLRNTRERLTALFGPAASLDLTCSDGTSIATLRVPARTAPTDALITEPRAEYHAPNAALATRG